MDEYVEAGRVNQAAIEDFVARYPFPIDDFQLESVSHLLDGRSVMVAAPTGTGKTLVAEFAVWLAQKRGQRIIYTTPLKALSNQKYRDMRELYGYDNVGLVTGDIVEHSHASIVIMTTEVYRNMLLEDGGERFVNGERLDASELRDVGFVVFDELHYLSDFDRGPVWEEAIICSPKHVQLVGLSATVSNAEDLASWISRVHRPISLVFHEQRAVPLEHYYYYGDKIHLVQDAEGNRVNRFPRVGGEAKIAQMMNRRRIYVYDNDEEGEVDEEAVTEEFWDKQENRRKGRVPNREQRRRAERRGKSSTARAQQHSSAPSTASAHAAPNTEEGSEAEERPVRPRQRQFFKAPEPGETLTALRNADMLPCLYFLPGRRVVEEAATSASLHSFTTPEEEAFIREEIGIWLDRLPPEDRNLQQVLSLTNMLPRGIAFHHAGLLPGLKVLVETLFAQGHLRAVFATDTLALGVNMPARTVVVGSLSKFDGQEMRLLTPNEYRQLTGRAGRRGMDVRGSAVIPYSPWEPFEDAFQRITGEMLPVTSSFVIRYNSVLNLWRPGDVQHLRRICASSLREYQRYLIWELNEYHRLEKRYQKARKSGNKKGAASEGAFEALEKRRQRIGSYPLSRAGAAELDGTIFALRALGHIGQNDELTLKGRLLRGIFHPAGIMLVEMIMRGVFDGMSPNEVAEICSWFTFSNDKRLHNRNVLASRLARVRRDLYQVLQHVHGIEERAGINFSPSIQPEFHGVAFAWSRGMSLNALLNRIELAEGDILMLLNQTIDLLQQVQAAVGQVADMKEAWDKVVPLMTDGVMNERNVASHTQAQLTELQQQRERLAALRPLFAQAASSLLRGIIIQSRMVPSMSVQIEDSVLPLDAEEDRDSTGLSDSQTFVEEV
ncbi:DEAD/DEAH box helicase [Ktedonobacter racemifer]|uniref:DEAD/DEAH box helicase n=1 Tax=Ktedonobacter racemifer TaxID=363277 RepID=UPI00069923C2|nr:DEAD/DEAH box helicase [Ktedonobacter racemifer]